MKIELYILAYDVFKHKKLTIYHYYGEDSSGNFVLLEYIHHNNGTIEGEISFIVEVIETEIEPIIVSIDYNEKFMFIRNCKESFKTLTQNYEI